MRTFCVRTASEKPATLHFLMLSLWWCREAQWLKARLGEVKVSSQKCGGALNFDQVCNHLTEQKDASGKVLATLQGVMNKDENLKGVPSTMNQLKLQLVANQIKSQPNEPYLRNLIQVTKPISPNKANRGLQTCVISFRL